MVRVCFSTSGLNWFCHTLISCVGLDHRLPIRAGYQNRPPVKALDLENTNDLTCPDETDNWDTGCFK